MSADTMPRLQISSPSDLISAAPYLIGFTPTESVVLVGLSGKKVVVTIRVNISDGEPGLTEAMGIASKQVEQVLLITYTEQSVPHWLTMPPACSDALLVTGGRWRSLLCTNRACCPPGGTPLAGDATIVAVTAVAAGLVAMTSRDEVTAALQPAEVTQLASEQAAALSPIADRDRVWLEIEASFAAGEDLHLIAAHYLDIARHCGPGRDAAAAWFLYAWTAWRIGDGIRAKTALTHLFTHNPAYSAAQLLQSVLEVGINPTTTPALTEMNGETG